MAAKTSCHRYGTKLRHCHRMYTPLDGGFGPCSDQTWNWVIVELGHWVTGWVGHLGHLSCPGHRVIILTRCETEFFPFSKKCPKCKTYIWNAEMTKVIVRCLLLDWNRWMSVHAMNFSFYLWLLKVLWLENTSSWRQWRYCSIFTFIIEQGHHSPGQLGLRVAGFPGHWVAGSQNVTQFRVWLGRAWRLCRCDGACVGAALACFWRRPTSCPGRDRLL